MQFRTSGGRAGGPEAVIVRLDAALAGWDGASVRVHDLARAGGVSARTLHRVFARHYGAPPIAHLRRERLQRVRQDLLAAGPGETVTSVAFDWGFSHLGRFAAFYETCFGERPSETLRRGRAIGRVQAAPAA
jgi:transcriptional regulator GlxA family with amidase domain